MGGLINEEIVKLPIKNKVLFTFSNLTLARQAEITSLRIRGHVHPWIYYKEKRAITRSPNPNKILFFPLHTVEGYLIEGMNDFASIEILNSLGEPKENILISLHWNDIDSPRKEFFAKMGFETISFGNPMNGEYVDKFYKYAQEAKFAISESWTSGLAFLVDLGVPCQIIPRDLQILSKSEMNKNVGFSNPEVKKEIQKAEIMFAHILKEVSPQQREFVEDSLGYSFRANYGDNRRNIYKLYFSSIPSWVRYIIGMHLKRYFKK